MRRDNHQGNVGPQTTTFGWEWPGVPLINQIVRFFDHKYLWKESSDILVFLHAVRYQVYVHLWLDMAYCVSQPIRIAGFFDHQYLWKESIDILAFSHGVKHQAREIISSGLMWPIMSLVQSDCSII